jgi:hypothetical protein
MPVVGFLAKTLPVPFVVPPTKTITARKPIKIKIKKNTNYCFSNNNGFECLMKIFVTIKKT